jgi:hypothetical protein
MGISFSCTWKWWIDPQDMAIFRGMMMTHWKSVGWEIPELNGAQWWVFNCHLWLPEVRWGISFNTLFYLDVYIYIMHSYMRVYIYYNIYVMIINMCICSVYREWLSGMKLIFGIVWEYAATCWRWIIIFPVERAIWRYPPYSDRPI